MYAGPEIKRGHRVIELCAYSCNGHQTKFSWHKSWNCPECAQLSLVYCSLHETFAQWFQLHYSLAFCSPCIPFRKKTKNTKYHISSVISVPVCRTRPTKIRITVSQDQCYAVSTSFHDTPVQLVQIVHRFASWLSCHTTLPSAHAARKRKTWWKARFRCYMLLSAQRTSNQDGLLHDPTVTKVTHYPQITKFEWTTSATSRLCTAVPRALKCCLRSVMQFSTSVRIHSKGKHTTNSTISMFLLSSVYTLPESKRGCFDRSVPKFMHYVQEAKSSWHKMLQKTVSCTIVSMKHLQSGSSCTMVSPFVPWQKENQKHTKYDIFSVLSVQRGITTP